VGLGGVGGFLFFGGGGGVLVVLGGFLFSSGSRHPHHYKNKLFTGMVSTTIQKKSGNTPFIISNLRNRVEDPITARLIPAI